MASSTELINRMRERSEQNDTVRSITTDLWTHARNIPYMTTVYQTVQEMNAAVKLNGHAPEHFGRRVMDGKAKRL